MSNVVRLSWVERPFVDTEILMLLQSEVGSKVSKDLIERAAFELSDRLWAIEQALFEGNLREVSCSARNMMRVAHQIGLHDLARIAKDLDACCAAMNFPALGAVSARLQRTGEASLQFAVQFQETAR